MTVQTHSDNSIRIARNTMMLYIRTIVTILVALYTSRVVLNLLGEEDYGVYTIVGGVVVLFAFAQAAMANATQRFLNFEMGRGAGADHVSKIFSVSVVLHIAIALLVVVLCETVGVWFVVSRLNIPDDRVGAAMWVYQLSIATAALGVVRVPFHASIIAHERMSFYAYVSIVESLLNLSIVGVLAVVNSGRLVLYSAMILGLSVVVLGCYMIYCRRRIGRSTRFEFQRDRGQYINLLSFSGWNLLGSASSVLAPQGVNILINIFFGVVVNAAVGVATQVQMAVWAFASNFQMAFNPQLVRSYAAGEQRYFEKLICQTSKSSFMLLYIIVLPLFISAQSVLALWLGDVPQFTLQFTRGFLIFLLFEATSSPIWVAVNGVGQIKWYQIILSTIIILNLPVAWLLFKLGYDPTSAVVAKVALAAVALAARSIYLSRVTDFSLAKFVGESIVPILAVVAISSPAAWYFSMLWGDVVGAILGLIFAVVAIVAVGLNRAERRAICENIIKQKCQ